MADTRKPTTASGPYRSGPAPHRLPLLGHVLPLSRRPLDFLSSLPAHGDLVEIHLGTQRAYLICHPDLVHEVLVDSTTFDKGGWLYDKLRHLVGDGLVTSARPEHRRQRRLVQPAFHPTRLAQYAEVMRDEAAAAGRTWRPGAPLDVVSEMHRVTTRITTRTLFATEMAADTMATLQRWLPVFLRGVYRRAMSPLVLLERLPTRGNRRYATACSHLHAVIDRIITDHRRRSHDDGSLLSALLTSEDPDTGDHLTDREIHEHVMAILLAATEEVTAALSWTFHLLSRHPDIERKLHLELDGILKGRPPTPDALPDLDFTIRTITETLRICPPVWLFTRTTTTPTELAGRAIPSRTTILISPYVLHHNPRLFPEPDKFDPDRWLPTATDSALRRTAMLPFGAGSRKCIGDDFAMTWTTLLVAAISAQWTLSPTSIHTMPAPRATFSPGQLLMVPRRRFT